MNLVLKGEKNIFSDLKTLYVLIRYYFYALHFWLHVCRYGVINASSMFQIIMFLSLSLSPSLYFFLFFFISWFFLFFLFFLLTISLCIFLVLYFLLFALIVSTSCVLKVFLNTSHMNFMSNKWCSKSLSSERFFPLVDIIFRLWYSNKIT